MRASLTESLLHLTDAKPEHLDLLRRFLKDSSARIRVGAATKIALIGAEGITIGPGSHRPCRRFGRVGSRCRSPGSWCDGRDAKVAIPAAGGLFDRRTSEPVLVAAVKMLGTAGPDGIARLETLCQKALPSNVCKEMCIAFSRAKVDRVHDPRLDDRAGRGHGDLPGDGDGGYWRRTRRRWRSRNCCAAHFPIKPRHAGREGGHKPGRLSRLGDHHAPNARPLGFGNARDKGRW